MVKINSIFNDEIIKIAKASYKNKLLIFLGSGYSKNFSRELPSWQELLIKILNFINNNNEIEQNYFCKLNEKIKKGEPKDLKMILDELHRIYLGKDYTKERSLELSNSFQLLKYYLILNNLDKERFNKDVVSKNILSLTLSLTSIIITTNYDNLLISLSKELAKDQFFNMNYLEFTSEDTIIDLFKKGKNTIFPIHGYVEQIQENNYIPVIDTNLSYEKNYNQNSKLVSFISQFFNFLNNEKWTVLIIGYSLEDEILNILKDKKQIKIFNFYNNFDKNKNVSLKYKKKIQSYKNLKTITMNSFFEPINSKEFSKQTSSLLNFLNLIEKEKNNLDDIKKIFLIFKKIESNQILTKKEFNLVLLKNNYNQIQFNELTIPKEKIDKISNVIFNNINLWIKNKHFYSDPHFYGWFFRTLLIRDYFINNNDSKLFNRMVLKASNLEKLWRILKNIEDTITVKQFHKIILKFHKIIEIGTNKEPLYFLTTLEMFIRNKNINNNNQLSLKVIKNINKLWWLSCINDYDIYKTNSFIDHFINMEKWYKLKIDKYFQIIDFKNLFLFLIKKLPKMEFYGSWYDFWLKNNHFNRNSFWDFYNEYCKNLINNELISEISFIEKKLVNKGIKYFIFLKILYINKFILKKISLEDLISFYLLKNKILSFDKLYEQNKTEFCYISKFFSLENFKYFIKKMKTINLKNDFINFSVKNNNVSIEIKTYLEVNFLDDESYQKYCKNRFEYDYFTSLLFRLEIKLKHNDFNNLCLIEKINYYNQALIRFNNVKNEELKELKAEIFKENKTEIFNNFFDINWNLINKIHNLSLSDIFSNLEIQAAIQLQKFTNEIFTSENIINFLNNFILNFKNYKISIISLTTINILIRFWTIIYNDDIKNNKNNLKDYILATQKFLQLIINKSFFLDYKIIKLFKLYLDNKLKIEIDISWNNKNNETENHFLNLLIKLSPNLKFSEISKYLKTSTYFLCFSDYLKYCKNQILNNKIIKEMYTKDSIKLLCYYPFFLFYNIQPISLVYFKKFIDDYINFFIFFNIFKSINFNLINEWSKENQNNLYSWQYLCNFYFSYIVNFYDENSYEIKNQIKLIVNNNLIEMYFEHTDWYGLFQLNKINANKIYRIFLLTSEIIGYKWYLKEKEDLRTKIFNHFLRHIKYIDINIILEVLNSIKGKNEKYVFNDLTWTIKYILEKNDIDLKVKESLKEFKNTIGLVDE